MRVGFRKPSIKKSIKARTTGRVNRKINSLTDPFYGKKGVGVVRDPKRSINNVIYRRTTFGIHDVAKSSRSEIRSSSNKTATTSDSYAMSWIVLCGLVFLVFGFISLSVEPFASAFAFVCALSAFLYFLILRKKGY